MELTECINCKTVFNRSYEKYYRNHNRGTKDIKHFITYGCIICGGQLIHYKPQKYVLKENKTYTINVNEIREDISYSTMELKKEFANITCNKYEEMKKNIDEKNKALHIEILSDLKKYIDEKNDKLRANIFDDYITFKSEYKDECKNGLLKNA